MSADALVEVFVWWGAICSTTFVVLYPALSPQWRRTWIGWALLVSSTALALLLDLSLAGKVFGREFLAYGWIKVGVTGLVAAGTTLKVSALLMAKYGVVVSRHRGEGSGWQR